MKARLWLSVVVAALLLMNLVGCKKTSNEEAVEVKSQAEYKAEADKEITEANTNAEPGKIETEIKTETEN